MNVLSLFDGMSCGQLALQRLCVKVDKYYASEIDKHAIRATMNYFPDTIQIGDVTKVKASELNRIDLLMGGSPCQGFSRAGKNLSFDDPRSKLFWEFVRILDECREINPDVKFLLENVRMNAEDELMISRALGVQPIMINSALVSAQNRERLYWTNIGLEPSGLFGDMHSTIRQPQDKGTFLKDILEDHVDEKYYLSETALKRLKRPKDKASTFTAGGHSGGNHSDMDGILIQVGNIYNNNADAGRVYSPEGKGRTLKGEAGGGGAKMGLIQVGVVNDRGELRQLGDKSNCITASYWSGMVDNHGQRTMIREVKQLNPSLESGGKQPFQQNRVYDADAGLSPAVQAHLPNGHYAFLISDRIRRLTEKECCRLQTVPDDFFEGSGVSSSQQYKMLGNGWTVDVICHILSYL